MPNDPSGPNQPGNLHPDFLQRFITAQDANPEVFEIDAPVDSGLLPHVMNQARQSAKHVWEKSLIPAGRDPLLVWLILGNHRSEQGVVNLLFIVEGTEDERVAGLRRLTDEWHPQAIVAAEMVMVPNAQSRVWAPERTPPDLDTTWLQCTSLLPSGPLEQTLTPLIGDPEDNTQWALPGRETVGVVSPNTEDRVNGIPLSGFRWSPAEGRDYRWDMKIPDGTRRMHHDEIFPSVMQIALGDFMFCEAGQDNAYTRAWFLYGMLDGETPSVVEVPISGARTMHRILDWTPEYKPEAVIVRAISNVAMVPRDALSDKEARTKLQEMSQQMPPATVMMWMCWFADGQSGVLCSPLDERLRPTEEPKIGTTPDNKPMVPLTLEFGPDGIPAWTTWYEEANDGEEDSPGPEPAEA